MAWAVLFDLDGTLADTTDFLLRSMHHAFELAPDLRPSDADWVAGIGTPLRTQLRQFAPEPQVEPLYLRYRAYQTEHLNEQTHAFPAARSVVDALRARGHPLAIVTSKSHAIARASLDAMELRGLEVLIGADDVERPKPDPMPVRVALERLGRGPHEAVFVGDSPHDVASGNGAGVCTIAALWGPFTREVLERAQPTHLLERLDQLPALLERIGASRVA